jgi:dolichol kinase
MSQPTVWQLELGRKAVHLSLVVLPVWIWAVPAPWNHRGLVLAFLIVLAVDVLRLRIAPLHRAFDRRIGGYLRVNEHRGLISVHYMTGSAAFLAWVAPPAIAALAVASLVFGDAAAALVGRRWGRPRIGRKSLEGSAACFVVCLLLGLALLPGRPLVAAAAALVTTVIEASWLPVDDNLAVPLATAAVIAWLL